MCTLFLRKAPQIGASDGPKLLDRADRPGPAILTQVDVHTLRVTSAVSKQLLYWARRAIGQLLGVFSGQPEAMASLLGRATRLCAKQTFQALSKGQGQAAEATSALLPKQAWSSRGFAAGAPTQLFQPQQVLASRQCSQHSMSVGSGHGHGDVTHAGLTLHKPGQWHRIATEVATGTMW